MFISITSTTSAREAASSTCREGKGNRVTGRIIPTGSPSSLAHWIAVLLTRAEVPKAMITTAAPSRRYGSNRTSSSSIRRYFR